MILKIENLKKEYIIKLMFKLMVPGYGSLGFNLCNPAHSLMKDSSLLTQHLKVRNLCTYAYLSYHHLDARRWNAIL